MAHCKKKKGHAWPKLKINSATSEGEDGTNLLPMKCKKFREIFATLMSCW